LSLTINVRFWLLADREFVGSRWMDFLNKNKIPFAIRVKESLSIVLENGKACSIKTLLRHRRARRAVHCFEGRLPDTATPVRIAIKQLKTDEWLIVMTNRGNAAAALNAYRKRWRIECLFGDHPPWKACHAAGHPCHGHQLGLSMRHANHGTSRHRQKGSRPARKILVPRRLRCLENLAHGLVRTRPERMAKPMPKRLSRVPRS
jgi:hypothetical protein